MRKPLPTPAVIGLIVSCGFAVLAVGWLFAVHPLGHKAASLRAQTAAVQQQIDTDLQQAAAARSGAPTIKVADLYRLSKAMPSIADVPDLLIELDQLARSSQVELDAITPSAPLSLNNGYSKISISLSVKGGFYAVSNLLSRLRNLVYVHEGTLEANGRLFSVDSVSLTPLSGKQIAGTLSVDAYVFGNTSSTTAATTTTATTTSSTTTTTPTSSGPSAAGAP